MNKILKTVAGITLLLVFAMLLTGCISIEMKVNKNGSCDLKYEIKTEGMISLSEVKQQLQNGIDELNENAGKTVAKLKSIKEKDGTITANISVSDISLMDEDAFFGKYSEFDKKYPEELKTLVDAKSGKPIDKPALKGTGGLNVVMLSGMETGGGDLMSFTMILPGAVKYTSSNVTVIDDKTVSPRGGYGAILYKRGGGGGWLLIVLIIIAVAAIGFVLLGKKKKDNPTASFNAGTATAPVASGTENSGGVICPHCNSVQKNSAIFCSACGGRIAQ